MRYEGKPRFKCSDALFLLTSSSKNSTLNYPIPSLLPTITAAAAPNETANCAAVFLASSCGRFGCDEFHQGVFTSLIEELAAQAALA